VNKPAGLGENLKQLFRKAVKALTGHEPAPKPKSRRRKSGETEKAFYMAAREIAVRSAVAHLVERAKEFVWDTLHWLHLWEWNGAEELQDGHHDHSDTNSDFSPHL
jgi:hypothetical protein